MLPHKAIDWNGEVSRDSWLRCERMEINERQQPPTRPPTSDPTSGPTARPSATNAPLKLEPNDAPTWSELGIEGGGIVSGETHSKAECYQRALEIDTNDASTWYLLGHAGSGIISGKTHSKSECYQRTLEMSPTKF